MFLFRLPLTVIALPFRMLSGIGSVISFAFKTFLLGLVAFAAVSAGPGTEGEQQLDSQIDILKSRIAAFDGQNTLHDLVEQWVPRVKQSALDTAAWAETLIHSGPVTDCARK